MQGLESSLQPCLAHRSLIPSPRASLQDKHRSFPRPGISRNPVLSVRASSGTLSGRCSAALPSRGTHPLPRTTGPLVETKRSHARAHRLPSPFRQPPSPRPGWVAALVRCRLRAAVAAAEVGAMTQEIMRQIRRRRGEESGRGGEAAASFGPTPAPPDAALQLGCGHTRPRLL